MNILVEPNDYMAGYSAIPIRVSDADATTSEQFKYLINIIWNKVTFSSVSDAFVNGQVNTVLELDATHSFKKGETIFINDTANNNTNSGYYNITAIISNTKIAIDQLFEIPFGGNTAIVSRVIKYKLSPDIEVEAKIDLSNTIKDFVTQNLEDTNDIFEGPDTLFNYDISIGSESRILWPFDDNFFVAGNIGFIYTGTTNIADVPFNIGDEIFIQQEIEAWDYFDNQFFPSFGGNIGYTGTTTHNFTTGNTIQVVGQITNPQYNGFTTVIGVPDAQSLVTNVPIGLNTPPEGGTIYGFSRPEYNGVAVITDIITGSTSFGDGVVIVTDKPFTQNTTPIGGTIRYADNRLTIINNEALATGKTAYNAHINRLDYSVAAFDPYVIQNRVSSLNNISTILGNTDKYRIEQSTKSWLLVHTDGLTETSSPVYNFYDSSNNLITTQIVDNVNDYQDFYIPVGIDQLLASPNLTPVGASIPLSAATNIDYYNVSMSISAGTESISNDITFELNDDCSRYDIYHLLWKDRYGSWLSYPFIYVSKDFTEVERKTYYQTEGNWDNNTFGYDTYGRGEKNYFGRSRNKVLLNSGWVDEYENLLMRDLMESTAVYVQTPDNVLIAGIIEENQIELKKGISDQIFNYSFNVRLSNNEVRF